MEDSEKANPRCFQPKNDFWGAFQIIVSGHQRISSPFEGGFDDGVILRVAAETNLSRDKHNLGLVADGRYQVPDLLGAAPMFTRHRRAAEHIEQFG